MRRRILLALGLLSLVPMVGCKSLQQIVENIDKRIEEEQSQGTRAYSLPKNKVWEGVMHYFTSNAITIQTIDKPSGLIYAEPDYTTGDIYHLANCFSYRKGEKPGIASVKLNIHVTPNEAGDSTTVTVNTRFKQSWVGPGIETQVRDCTTRGRIEREIHATLREYLGITEDSDKPNDLEF